MAIQLETKQSFDKTSPVARYWLAQCEGFHVDGLVKGTVEEVLGIVDPQTPEALVVRRGWRRRTIPVGAVNAVVPAARLIVVDKRRAAGTPTPAQRRTRSVAEKGSRAASSLAAVVVSKGPPALRFVAGVALSLGFLVATALATFAQLLLIVTLSCARIAVVTARRLRSDLGARANLEAEKHRRPKVPRTPRGPLNPGRKLSRAAVLGLGRDAGRRSAQREGFRDPDSRPGMDGFPGEP
jgi:hypothetical protein